MLRHQSWCRSRFSATNAVIRRHADDRERVPAKNQFGWCPQEFRRSSDSCFAFLGSTHPASPSRGDPSDRLSPMKQGIGTYSGGTVRDFHPVILFSIPGSPPEMPRNFFSVVRNIVAQFSGAVKVFCHCEGAKRPWQSPKGFSHSVILSDWSEAEEVEGSVLFPHLAESGFFDSAALRSE